MEFFKIIAIFYFFATPLQARTLPTPQALTFEDLGHQFDNVLHIQKEDQTFKKVGKEIGETIDDFIDHPIDEFEKGIQVMNQKTNEFVEKVMGEDQTLQEIGEEIGKNIAEEMEEVDEETKDFFQRVYDFGKNAYNKIKNGIANFFGGLVENKK